MSGTKNILSVFLLTVYFISFGHNVIPHHHHSEFEENCQYSSAKKTDCHEQESEHAHFNHNNHLDEGILAFLSCLLSSVEHHSDCEVALVAENLNVNKKSVEVDIIGDFNLSFHTFNRTTEPIIQLVPFLLSTASFSGFTETYTLRGPPHLT